MKRRKRQPQKNEFDFTKLEPRKMMAGDLGELNLVANGDFSEIPATTDIPNLFVASDVAGWNAVNEADGQRIALFTFETDDGPNTVLSLDSSDEQIDFVFQEIETEADEDYIITFDLRGQIPESGLVVEEVEVFWNDELVGTFESSEFWVTHAITVTGAADGDSRLEFREQASGDALEGNGFGVLIDNVNVAVVDASPVTNGSFENVTGDGPFFSNGNVEGFSALDRGGRPDFIQIQSDGINPNVSATDGSNVLNLDTTNELVDHVYTDFATVEGQLYYVTFDLFADGSQIENPDEVRVRWKTPEAAIQTDQWIATVEGNNTWQSYGFLVTGLGDLSRLELREPAGSPGDGSGALIDNIRLFALDGIVNDLSVDPNGTADGNIGTAELVQGVSSTDIASDLTLTHASGEEITSATVTITESVAQSQDELSVVVGDSGIVQAFDASTGTLSLTGSADIATYQSVLQTLQYTNTGATPTPGTRTVAIVVTDSNILGTEQSSEAVTINVDVVANVLAISAIAPQTVEAGSPLWVTFDIDNPGDVPLLFNGQSGDSSLLTTQFETGDSWRLNIESPNATTNGVSTPLSGEITFQLFEEIYGEAGSRATDRIRTLTNEGFYDGIIFHRIDSDFVIQGGDPTGTGSGGSDLGDFDDQFSTLLQHNRTGLLSFAKSLDDTNDSQFFITDTATRFLDFQHTIFGVVTSGEELRESIANVDIITDPANPGNSEFPAGEVTITSAEIFQDNQTGAALLIAPEGVTGETTLTITVSDANGNETTQEITVNIVAPTDPNSDSNPFLDDIPVLEGFNDVEQTFQLTAQDVENDDVVFLDIDAINDINSGLAFQNRIQLPSFADDDSFSYSVDSETGLLTFTPGEAGTSATTVEFIVGVAQSPRPGEGIFNGNVDLQVVTLNVLPVVPPTA